MWPLSNRSLVSQQQQQQQQQQQVAQRPRQKQQPPPDSKGLQAMPLQGLQAMPVQLLTVLLMMSGKMMLIMLPTLLAVVVVRLRMLRLRMGTAAGQHLMQRQRLMQLWLPDHPALLRQLRQLMQRRALGLVRWMGARQLWRALVASVAGRWMGAWRSWGVYCR